MGEIIAKINEKEAPVIETIPKIIIQIWVQKDGGPVIIPKREVQYMEMMRKMNPSFQHMFFDGNDVAKFFETNYPEYYTVYNNLPIFIQKLDFFRYLAIYHYGGFYFDVDIQPLRPLDDAVRNHQTVFPIDEYIPDCNPRFKPICERNMHFLLGQYAFGAIPKHPFLKFLVDTIHQNLDLYVNLYRKSGNNEIYVYRTTGPDFVSYVYANYVYKNQVYILENGKRQMFGDYARHDYYGSWK
jgi:mannosyltransferase OCH1-like enzyme